ncbi:MAG: VWA domain-containing protein, partial [Pirellulales bacterium]
MIQWQFHWPWIVSPWAMGLGLLAVLAWVVIHYGREAKKLADQNAHWQGRLGYVVGLIVIRLLVLGLLVVLWSEPTIERTRMGKPSLVLLIDRSASMNHIDPATSLSVPKSAQPSRFTRMVQTLLAGKPSCLERLEESYHVELVAFAEDFRRLQPTGSQSLTELLRGLPSADPLPPKEGHPEEGHPDKRPPAATRLGDAVDFALQRIPETGYSRAGLAGAGLAGAGLAGAGPAVIVL